MIHHLFVILSYLSIAVAAAALVRDVWRHRGQGGHPLVLLVRERFGRRWGSPALLVLLLLAGLLVTFVPLLVGVSLGWAHVSLNHQLSGAVAAGSLLNVLLVAVWAGAEELTFRGSVLTACLRFSPPPVALLCTSLLFAMEHLGANKPSAILTAVWFMDGICFGIACLLTGSLWASSVWHAAHNLGIWAMGFFVVQFAPGPFHVVYGAGGDSITLLYGAMSAGITLIAVVVFVRAARRGNWPGQPPGTAPAAATPLAAPPPRQT